MFRENEFSFFGKTAIYVLLILVTLSCVSNVIKGVVPNPYSFLLVAIGLAIFLVAKISLLSKGVRFSFGTKKMSNQMANLYRVGYWLMVVGIIFTFLG
jgi:bacteriorhodopsin